MKLIRARSSRAPAPISTEKRAPDIFAARSKSRMPSAAPMSQCGLRLEVERARLAVTADFDVVVGGLPDRHRRMRAGSAPSSADRSRFCSTSSSAASSCLICCPRALFAAKTAEGSSPCFFARATSSPDGVLLAFEILRPRGSAPAASRPARRTARGCASGSRPRFAEAGSHLVEMFADVRGIEHDGLNPIPGRQRALGYDAFDDARRKKPSERPCSPPPDWEPASSPRPRRSRKRCCRSSTSRSSSTASRRRCASGINNMILVTGRGKNAIEDHFDVSVELETFLESRGKTQQLAEIRQDLEPDQRLLRAPGRAARPRSRRPGHANRSSATSPSRSSSATT